MKFRRVFPLGVRIWRWWCDVGPKNRVGGTVGGSFALRRLRDRYDAYYEESALSDVTTLVEGGY